MSFDKWPSYQLGQLVDITSSKRVFSADYVPQGVPFYRSKEIIEQFNGQDVSTELFISEKHFDEINDKFGVPEKDDLLLTSVGTLGIPYLVKGNDKFYFKDGNLTWFRNFTKDLKPRFLYYWFQSPTGKYELETRKIGTTQQALTITALKRVVIDLPPFEVQEWIAAVLSALDEKIELNRQTNATLKAIAQAIFKAWFVHYHYPGATGELVDSELGPIPAGWRIGYLGELLSFKNGKSSPERHDDFAYPVYGANGIIGKVEVANTSEKSIVVGRVGSFCGAVYYLMQKSFVTDNAIIAKPKFHDSSLYCFILLDDLNLNNYKVGSGQPLLNQRILSNIRVVIPSQDVMVAYEKIALSHFKKIHESERESQNLAQIRDALLPRLMRGDIEV